MPYPIWMLAIMVFFISLSSAAINKSVLLRSKHLLRLLIQVSLFLLPSPTAFLFYISSEYYALINMIKYNKIGLTSSTSTCSVFKVSYIVLYFSIRILCSATIVSSCVSLSSFWRVSACEYASMLKLLLSPTKLISWKVMQSFSGLSLKKF